jgi:hypothetical protein
MDVGPNFLSIHCFQAIHNIYLPYCSLVFTNWFIIVIVVLLIISGMHLTTMVHQRCFLSLQLRSNEHHGRRNTDSCSKASIGYSQVGDSLLCWFTLNAKQKNTHCINL